MEKLFKINSSYFQSIKVQNKTISEKGREGGGQYEPNDCVILVFIIF